MRKIKDLTIGDIKKICKKHRRCNNLCPLYEHELCCINFNLMNKKELESEIDYD